MAERKQCAFQLIRYVPDPVRNEFVNIGVLLRALQGEQRALRFTRDWARVRCLDPDADIAMLEAMEIEVGERLQAAPADSFRPILKRLEDTLSNGVQITESKAYLADSFLSALEDLMSQYVDTPKRERNQKRGGRSALVAAMRRQFEDAGVWTLMRKQIAVAPYTKPGDPMRIDCGYRNGVLKLFQAVSLESNAADAKLLAFAAPSILSGVRKAEGVDVQLTAFMDRIGWPAGEGEPEEERSELYAFARATMEEQKIAVMTLADLPRFAARAREDLRV